MKFLLDGGKVMAEAKTVEEAKEINKNWASTFVNIFLNDLTDAEKDNISGMGDFFNTLRKVDDEK